MKISNRLKQIGDLVDDNANLIDVGCDHALLDIYLYQTKKNLTITASDINEKPLENAQNNLIKYNLQDKIALTKMDGIENINKDIDTIIISGMGTKTIIDILLKDKTKLTNIKNIIISTNNDYYLLRKTLIKNNYYIEKEKIILEKNKFYPVILFKKGKKYHNKFTLKYGPYTKEETYIKYLTKEKEKLQKINKNLPNKYLYKKIINNLQIKKLVKKIN